MPQGTVPRPLLFLLYINDLPDVVKQSKVSLFADDSLLYRNIKNEQDQALNQEDLDALATWETTWQMSFNPSKCNVIHILHGKGKTPRPFEYHLHGQKLGVTISNNWSWSQHIDNVAAKGKWTVGFLRRNFKECTKKVKSATYTIMVRPSLEYASAVWNLHQEKDIKSLEKIQRGAARFVFNNYTDRTPGTVTSMLNALRWDNLEMRRRNNVSRHALQDQKLSCRHWLLSIPKILWLSNTRNRPNLPRAKSTSSFCTFLLPSHRICMEPPPDGHYISPIPGVVPLPTWQQPSAVSLGAPFGRSMFHETPTSASSSLKTWNGAPTFQTSPKRLTQ